MKKLAIASGLTLALAFGGVGLVAGPASAGVIKGQNGGGFGEFELGIEQVGPSTFLYEMDMEVGGAFSGDISEEGTAQVNENTGQFVFHSEEGSIEGSFADCVNSRGFEGSESDSGSGRIVESGSDVVEASLNSQLSSLGSLNSTFSLHLNADEFDGSEAFGSASYTAHWSCANH